MFPSSGLFANIRCPVSKRELCERPHCLYKHASAKEVWGIFSASCKSSVIDTAGVQNGVSSTVTGTTEICLQELERLNKAIETIKHEVEQERRRLSRYQTEVQADCKSTAQNIPVLKTEFAGKHVDEYSHAQSSRMDLTKTCRAKKYVVDNSKPRTDLEYDPLTNFSADLRSYSSLGKEQKVKNGQSLKRGRDSPPCDQKKPVAKTHLSQLGDESNEDDILIIDIPPSPDKKRARTQKVADSVSCKSEDTVIDIKSECRKKTCHTAETKVENCPEPVSLPTSTDEQDQRWNNLVVKKEENTSWVESPKCEPSSSGDKMNPLQPHNFPSKNSLFYDAQAASSPSRAQIRGHHDHWSPRQSASSVVPGSQKMSSKMPGPLLDKVIQASSVKCEQQAETPSGSKQFQPLHPSSTSFHSYVGETSSEPTEQFSVKAEKGVIVISSSESEEEEEELNYSDENPSDSDTMEECYRIFMEAQNEDIEKEQQQPSVSVGLNDVQKPEFNVTPQVLPGRKRVAHEAKLAEQPAAKVRAQPQILVPLRGPAASQSAVTSKIQQVQQRASMLTSSVKGGQAFLSATCQRKPESQTAAYPPIQTTVSTQPAPLQNAYINYLPMATAVIEVGDNLQLILPEGAFPLPQRVLTPVGQVRASTSVNPAYYPAAVAPVQQRCHRTAPVFFPVPARKPFLTPTLAHTSQVSSSISQSVGHGITAAATAAAAAAKPVPVKRKLKQQCEAPKDKVPRDVRQRYITMFTEEFLKTTASVNDALEKAVAEERTVYNRSMNKLKYLSIAVNLLKRLKNQTAASAKDKRNVNSQKLKGSIPLDLKNLKGNDDTTLYESLKDYTLTEERLIESNYPVQHPEKPGSAALFADNKKGNTDPLKRICCRCGATYSVNKIGKHIRKEECNYHYGKGVKHKVPGGMETRYSCCEGVMGAPGCQVYKLHVHDSLSLDGFVSTIPRHPSDTSCPGVYALNCEMCYTVHGLELSRVTVVNSSLQVVYDTFVRPGNEVIDYNTRFSGISEEDVKGNNTSLREVQETLLSFISADTVLIGHSLETDLCALKLLHGTVVDTSVVFPHRLGPPNKQTLNNLTAEYLRRIIQESVCGHDTAEDAAACMELMIWKLKEDGKLKKL